MNSTAFASANITPQQMQFQQAMLNGSRNITPTNIYGNFANAPAGFDNYRGNVTQQTPPMSTSPMVQNGAYPPPGFPPMMNGGMMGGYGGYTPQMPYYPQQPMQQQNGGRRGRVGSLLHLCRSKY